jgi:hypothetical protein
MRVHIDYDADPMIVYPESPLALTMGDYGRDRAASSSH